MSRKLVAFVVSSLSLIVVLAVAPALAGEAGHEEGEQAAATEKQQSQPAAKTAEAPAGEPAEAEESPLVEVGTIEMDGKPMQVLTNPDGMTLYYFTQDTPSVIACTGACAEAWPPMMAYGEVEKRIPGIPGEFSTLEGQLTYNGHPLYTYIRDTSAGQALGQGMGREWFVATPDLEPATEPDRPVG